MNHRGKLFGDFCREVDKWPSGIELDKERVLGKCCAIHVPVECGVDGAKGCVGWKVGTHSSIRALYQSGRHYCHAFPGMRELDYRLARNAMTGPKDFVEASFSRRDRFVRTYMSGFPIDLSVYGAGYCYLLPFVESVRSRVARILGPFPLLADVVRLAWFVGARDVEKFVLFEVSQGVWHLERAGRVHDRVSWLVFLGTAMRVLENNASARLGAGLLGSHVTGDGRQSLRILLEEVWSEPDDERSLALVARMANETGGMVGCYKLVMYQRVDGSPLVSDAVRQSGLKVWFEKRGLILPSAAVDELLLATCAPSFVSEPALKCAKRMWAILGDSLIKTFHALHVLSEAGSAESYSRLSSRATNASLANVLETSGLRQFCRVEALSVASKTNADILESVVGVYARHCGILDVRKLLVILGVVPAAVVYLSEFDGLGSVGGGFREGNLSDVGLNSLQHARAVKLALAGLL